LTNDSIEQPHLYFKEPLLEYTTRTSITSIDSARRFDAATNILLELAGELRQMREESLHLLDLLKDRNNM
jgi:hypothetical protein